jgi:hypothetical protein
MKRQGKMTCVNFRNEEAIKAYGLFVRYSDLLSEYDSRTKRECGDGFDQLVKEIADLDNPEVAAASQDLSRALCVLTSSLVRTIGDAKFWKPLANSFSGKDEHQWKTHYRAYLVARKHEIAAANQRK